MTVRKGESWGVPGGLPAGSPVVGSDRDLRAIIEGARRQGTQLPTVGLVGGDLHRTLGGKRTADELLSTDCLRLPIDVVSVLLDGRQFWFVSHLIARRSWWRGRVVAVMNAQFLGRWDLAPRSHPNDGMVDVSDGDLPVGDRLKARRRLPTGSHIPHPAIATRRVKHETLTFDRPIGIWLDGVDMGTASNVVIRVEPDAATVVA